MHSQRLLPIAAAFAALFATSAMADPIYTLTIQDSAGAVTVNDGGTGQISYSGTLGGFTIDNLSVNDINPLNPFDVAFASQDIFKASGNDTLNVFVTVSNLTAPVPSSLWIGTTSSANFENGSILGWSTKTYFDPTGAGNLAQLLSSSSGGGTTNSFTSSTAGSTSLSANPFSYTVEFSLNLLTNEFANGAGATTDVLVPEPGSMALLAAGLMGVAMVRRRRA